MRSDLSLQRSPQIFDEDDAWAIVRGVGKLARTGAVGTDAFGVVLEAGTVTLVPRAAAELVVTPDEEPVWEARTAFSEDARRLLDLSLPLCVGERAPDLIVAHLGQSVDGRITTPSGASPLITGAEDVCHTHRMRALFDAVVVGATTIAVDDPQLTTRLVSGDHPVRVVLDPRGRLSHAHHVFTDGAAASLVVTTVRSKGHYSSLASNVEVLAIDADGARLPLGVVREELRRRGLRRLFVEGGGVTVSRFIEEGLVDHLQIAVAPKIIGQGEPAIQLDNARLSGLRSRRFLFGEDVLFDFDLSGPRRSEGQA
jgi:diaminohydroxyphosphoribosylaminopyrimidine deaminase / 5-amino-6-(5-phosphoribosylamino)uracil reductase